MVMKLSINSGFITNSSSVVHGFDKELLEDPDVAAFMAKYEIQGGYVNDVWYRSCDSIAVTPEQKQNLIEQFASSDYSPRAIPVKPDDNQIVVVYGDEYDSLASQLCGLLSSAAKRLERGEIWEDYFN